MGRGGGGGGEGVGRGGGTQSRRHCWRAAGPRHRHSLEIINVQLAKALGTATSPPAMNPRKTTPEAGV